MKGFPAAFVLVVAVISATAAAPDAAPPYLPNGAADGAGKVGYLTSPAGGIVAVDLETGAALWESKEMQQPLVVAGKRIIGLAPAKDRTNALHVVVLDTEAKGKRLLESEVVTLPDWAVVGQARDFGGVGGKSFRTRGRIADGGLELAYWASSRYFGGAAPTQEILKAATRDTAAAIHVDLQTGKVKALPGEPKQPALGMTPVDKLPKETQDTATANGWGEAVVIGPRAYGQLERQRAGNRPPFGSTDKLIQAIDLKTGKLVWERVVETRRILPPPP